MAQTGPQSFVVRLLQAPAGLDGAFRVHILPESLVHLNLKLGDLCEILHEDGNSLGFGIAWQATDRSNSNNTQRKPVKLSKTMLDAFGLEPGSLVSMRRRTAKLPIAETVTLTDVTPAEWNTGHEDDIEDGRWRWRSGCLLSTCELFASDITFEIAAKKNLKKRFHIEHIQSSDAQSGVPNVFTADDQTDIVINGQGHSTGSSGLIEGYVGGLLDQLQELNSRMTEVLSQTKEPASDAIDYEVNEGILIHGFEGTGKTLLLKYAAETKFRKVLTLKKSSLTASTASKNQDFIRNAFKDARAYQPSLILMDNLDKLVPALDDTYSDVINEELDKLVGSRVLVIATCRSPNDINNGIIGSGRLSAFIELPIPNQLAREHILDVVLSKKVDPEGHLARAVSGRTHGYTGKDLALVVKVAKSNAFRRYNEKYDNRLSTADTNGSGQDICSKSADDRAGVGTNHKSNGVADNLTQTKVVAGEDVRNGHTESVSRPPPQSDPLRPRLTMEDFEPALTKVKPTALREVIFQSPNVSWDNIGGSAALRERFDEILSWPLQYSNIMEQYCERPAKGVLLYGPPGCSKTLTAQAVASNHGHNFIAVKGAELINKYVGESERAVREMFRKARQAAPCVIFFDEFDSIASGRESDGTKGLNVLTTLLNEMDGFEALKGVLVLAATNRPEILDSAIMRPGRFDSHVYLGPPDSAARKEIFAISTKGRPIVKSLNFEKLVDATEGYTGAEIVRICQIATHAAMRRTIKGGSAIQPVTIEDFEKGLEQTTKAVTPEMLLAYHVFAKKTTPFQ
ncbi:AAA+-type ATPase [Vermiconidia calcicola]|uniref:AAA+-type ATPase n=1 Tax=Vermiconidia calcicola TaxID=1690605 RepID=A0ACC3MEA2_9PEZI|nr:AAA+-type ATPase [Vermiconidia calcicola]